MSPSVVDSRGDILILLFTHWFKGQLQRYKQETFEHGKGAALMASRMPRRTGERKVQCRASMYLCAFACVPALWRWRAASASAGSRTDTLQHEQVNTNTRFCPYEALQPLRQCCCGCVDIAVGFRCVSHSCPEFVGCVRRAELRKMAVVPVATKCPCCRAGAGRVPFLAIEA